MPYWEPGMHKSSDAWSFRCHSCTGAHPEQQYKKEGESSVREGIGIGEYRMASTVVKPRT